MIIPDELFEQIIQKLWEANMKVNKTASFYEEDNSFYELMEKLRKLQFNAGHSDDNELNGSRQ